MTFLLDINVLLALFDDSHIHHAAAHMWFAAVGKNSWATCAITENGFVRVVSNPAYRGAATSLDEAISKLRLFCSEPAHEFWPDTASLTDPTVFDPTKLLGHKQITDLYLAGLALTNGGKLATFDARIPVAALVGNPDVVELIPSP